MKQRLSSEQVKVLQELRIIPKYQEKVDFEEMFALMPKKIVKEGTDPEEEGNFLEFHIDWSYFDDKWCAYYIATSSGSSSEGYMSSKEIIDTLYLLRIWLCGTRVYHY